MEVSEKEKAAWGGGFISGLVVGVLIAGFSCALVLTLSDNRWKSEAVKHNAARYNPETAAFEWVQKEGE